MKARHINIIILIVFILLLVSCCSGSVFIMAVSPGKLDWGFNLVNGYTVEHINASNIYITCHGKSDADEIPSFVKEFAYDSRYVYSRNVSNIEENDIFNESYYILDTEKGVLLGKYDSFDKFKDGILKKGLSFPTKWYRTSPDPNLYHDEKNTNYEESTQ